MWWSCRAPPVQSRQKKEERGGGKKVHLAAVSTCRRFIQAPNETPSPLSDGVTPPELPTAVGGWAQKRGHATRAVLPQSG